jgi:hypothetical protein
MLGTAMLPVGDGDNDGDGDTVDVLSLIYILF